MESSDMKKGFIGLLGVGLFIVLRRFVVVHETDDEPDSTKEKPSSGSCAHPRPGS
jgi:hypothetical protein